MYQSLYVCPKFFNGYEGIGVKLSEVHASVVKSKVQCVDVLAGFDPELSKYVCKNYNYTSVKQFLLDYCISEKNDADSSISQRLE